MSLRQRFPVHRLPFFLPALMTLALAAAAQPAGPAGAAEGGAIAAGGTMAQRMQACVACHGKEGRATNQGYFPRIAGKPAGYLYNQLVSFRDGRRHNAPMAHLLEHMTDDYLGEIARHFAGLDLPYPPSPAAAVPPATLARGEALARRGDAQRGVPACAACHGEALTGVLPAMPGLLGLPRGYLLGQLGAWRSGQRHAAQPDCMADIARALSPDDVSAVAAWLASQPVPEPSSPAAHGPGPAPAECGSGLP